MNSSQDKPQPQVSQQPRHTHPFDGLHELEQLEDLGEVRATSQRVLVGPLIEVIRRFLKALLAPVLSRQSNYNRLNARLLRNLIAVVEPRGGAGDRSIGLSVREEALASDALVLNTVRLRTDELAAQLNQREKDLQDLAQQMARLTREMERLREMGAVPDSQEPQ